MQRTSITLRWLALAAILLLGLAACGGAEQEAGGDAATDAAAEGTEATAGEGGGEGQLLSENYDLSDVSIRFATKDFTEQLILGQLARQALEAAGASVDYTENLPSTAGPRDALTAGEIDAAWEYTGTAWINYLNNEEPIDDPMEQFEAVKEADLEENNIFWTDPAPFDDTYGIATRREFADENDLSTLADVAEFIDANPDQATLCLDNTFASRDDGLVRFEDTYDVDWPDNQLTVQDFSVIYQSTADGNPCNFGEIFTTDGRIQALDLAVMEDTESAFISYLSSVMIDNDFHEENPQVADLLAEISQPITEELMIELNAMVDVDGEFPEDVAATYLQDQGFVE